MKICDYCDDDVSNPSPNVTTVVVNFGDPQYGDLVVEMCSTCRLEWFQKLKEAALYQKDEE